MARTEFLNRHRKGLAPSTILKNKKADKARLATISIYHRCRKKVLKDERGRNPVVAWSKGFKETKVS